jgi:hypothetical protein
MERQPGEGTRGDHALAVLAVDNLPRFANGRVGIGKGTSIESFEGAAAPWAVIIERPERQWSCHGLVVGWKWPGRGSGRGAVTGVPPL